MCESCKFGEKKSAIVTEIPKGLFFIGAPCIYSLGYGDCLDSHFYSHAFVITNNNVFTIQQQTIFSG